MKVFMETDMYTGKWVNMWEVEGWLTSSGMLSVDREWKHLPQVRWSGNEKRDQFHFLARDDGGLKLIDAVQ